MPRPFGIASRFGFSLGMGWPASQVQAEADLWWSRNRTVLEVAQTSYALTHGGRFWQGLVSHTTIPLNTDTSSQEESPDRFTDKPTDQNETWQDVIPGWSSLKFPCAVKVNIYQAPGGQHGWEVVLEVKHSSNVYRRTYHKSGPETWREQGWALVPQIAV